MPISLYIHHRKHDFLALVKNLTPSNKETTPITTPLSTQTPGDKANRKPQSIFYKSLHILNISP
jgi:hypothetical protein